MSRIPQAQFVKAMEKIRERGLTKHKFGNYEIVDAGVTYDRTLLLYHYDTRILTFHIDRKEAEVSIFSRSDADAINSVLHIHGYSSAAGFGPSKGPSVRDVGDLKVELVPTRLANPYGLL